MKKPVLTLTITAIIILVAVISIWRYVVAKGFQQPSYSVLYDQSKSKVDGCSCLKEQARRILERSEAAGSTLMFFALGTPQSGYQPRLLATYKVPVSIKALERQSHIDQEKSRILNDLGSKCQAVPRSDVTPLFQGMKVVIEQMKSAGCRPGARCALIAQTDLEETVDSKVLQAFRGGHSKSNETTQPEVLDNQGIEVVFSGVSEVVVSDAGGRRDAAKKLKDEATKKLNNGAKWQKIWVDIFSDRSLLRFEPMCPRQPEQVAT